MALPVRKGYTGNGVQSSLTSNAAVAATSFNVAAKTGWPTTFPFFVVVDPGTASEEKMRVTAISTLTLTVVRGVDNTTDVAHSSGAVIYPVFTASEADEANQVASAMTTKGDLIATDGSTINRLAVGATNTHVLQVDSTATNGFKWAQVATAGIADDAITSAKILDGSIVNADINASAAIVDTKLATISTASKVSNSATTATNLNTASAIVARDASGNFVAGTITAALTGTASGNLVSGGALGTPSSGTLTNCTFPTLNQNTTGSSGSTTGNAATATALQTARNIGGVSFNGTADINLPGVNASGNQNTSGTATNATNLVGLFKGSSVVSMVSGSAAVPHGVGATPSTALVSNGDNSALSASFEIASLDGTNINVRQIGGTATTSVRVNWIAFA